jgi:hypothetical protein
MFSKNIFQLLPIAGINRILYVNIAEETIYLTSLRRIRRSTGISGISSGGLNKFHVVDIKEIPARQKVSEIQKSIAGMIDHKKQHKTGIFLASRKYMVNTVSVPNEEADVNQWIYENVNDIIPDFVSPDDYIIKAGEYATDEDSRHCRVVFARKKDIEHLESILDGVACAYKSIIPYEITAVLSQSLWDANNNVVFITIENRMAHYAFMHVSGRIIKGELFSDQSAGVSEAENDRSGVSITAMLDTINDHIEAEFGAQSDADIRLCMSVDGHSIPDPTNEIHDYANNHNTQLAVRLTDIHVCKQEDAMGAANLAYYDLDRLMNLQTDESGRTNRTKLEEKVVLRSTLFSAASVLLFLGLSFIADNMHSHVMEKNRQELAEINSIRELIRSTERENEAMRQNLSAILNLKHGRVPASFVLHRIPDYLPPTSWSTGMILRYEESGELSMEFKGIAAGQNDIARIMHRIESDELIHRSSLLYANAIPARQMDRAYGINRSNYIQYQFMVTYHAN